MQVSISLYYFALVLDIVLSNSENSVFELGSGEKVLIESKDYPDVIPPNLHMTWTIHCADAKKIKFKCRDIRTTSAQGDCGEDKVIVDDGSGPKELCGTIYDYEIVTLGNILKVQIVSGKFKSGGVSCSAEVDEDFEGTEIKLFLVPGGTEEKLQSPSYPETIQPNTRLVWRMETDPGSTIRITCTDIRLRKPEVGCYPEEVIKIYNGDNVKELCGSIQDYSELSSGHTLTVRLIADRGSGGLDCRVQGRVMDWYGEVTTQAYYEVESEEVDSSEFGGPPGTKNTTCKCGWSNKASKRIVNGVETEVNEFPFMASIYKKGTTYNFCGGSILTSYHVITAAHCTWYYVKENIPLTVYMGHHNRELDNETRATQIIDVAHIIEHPNFNTTWFNNDISLLTLKREIQFNQFVGPVCRPHSGWFDLTGKYLTVIGYGLLSAEGNAPDTLQKVHLRTISLEACEKRHPNTVTLEPKTVICTYGHNKSPCQGDSGGPVVWVDPETNRYTLVGIVSFGRVCADKNPAGHTAVASYIDWIEKHISENNAQETCTKAS